MLRGDGSRKAGDRFLIGVPRIWNGEVACFDKNSATTAGEGCVFAPMRAANPGTRWVRACFIAEFTLEDKYLLSTKMMMGFEIGIGLPPNQGCVLSGDV